MVYLVSYFLFSCEITSSHSAIFHFQKGVHLLAGGSVLSDTIRWFFFFFTKKYYILIMGKHNKILFYPAASKSEIQPDVVSSLISLRDILSVEFYSLLT